MKSKLTGGRFLLRLLAALAFLAILIVNLAPFVWGLLTSLKPARELMVYPPKFVGFSPSVEHYATVFAGTFSTATLNSIIYSVASIVVGILCAILAAYALTRYVLRNPQRNSLIYGKRGYGGAKLYALFHIGNE